MKKQIFALGLATSMFAVTASGAYAAKRTYDVSSGKEEMVFSQYIYNTRTCSAGPPPIIKIAKKPEHGTVAIKSITQKVPAGEKCAGRTITYRVVTYRSKAGFRGVDRVNIDSKFEKYVGASEYRSKRYRLQLNVK